MVCGWDILPWFFMLFEVLRITPEVVCQLCFSVCKFSPPQLFLSYFYGTGYNIHWRINLCIIEGWLSIVGQIQRLPGDIDVSDWRRRASAPLSAVTGTGSHSRSRMWSKVLSRYRQASLSWGNHCLLLGTSVLWACLFKKTRGNCG